MMDKYSTTFGVSIVTSGNNYYVGNFKENREITVDELNEMVLTEGKDPEALWKHDMGEE